MNIRGTFRLAVTSVLLVAISWAVPSWSEDIDLFIANPSGAADQRPTLLLVWDNAANNNANVPPVCRYVDDRGDPIPGTAGEPRLGADKSLGMQQCAMVNALTQIKNTPELMGSNGGGAFNLGLMVYNHNSFPNNGNGNCGYLKFPPTLMDSDNINSLIDAIKGFRSTGPNSNLASNTALGDTFAEAWAALNGRATSCSTSNYAGLDPDALQCRDSVIIFIGNAFTNSNSTDGNINPGAGQQLKNELTNIYGYSTNSPEYEMFATPIAVTGLQQSGNANNRFWADEWARFMKRVNVSDSSHGDRNVTTYTISVTDNSSQAQDTLNYYAMMARQGGGKNFLVNMDDPDALTRAILRVLNEVQAVNSVFASATLPVSANTQGTFLNQIYIAMFRPDGNAQPRWLGNIKQYQLGFDAGGNLVLTDSTFDPETEAVESITNPITGTVTPSAVSFWTTNTPGVADWPPAASSPPDGFWRNNPSGAGLVLDAPDGDLVEKGGAGQMLRVDNLTATYANAANENIRRLYTCNAVGQCADQWDKFSLTNGTLTSATSNPFGVSGATTGVRLEFGENAVQEATVECLSGAGTNRNCTLIYNGTPTYVPGADRIILPDLTNPKCGYNSSCAIINWSSTVVEFREEGNNNPLPKTTLTMRVSKPSTRRTAIMPNHGLIPGEQVQLSSCTVTDSAKTHNLPTLPGNARKITVGRVIDSNTFTFILGDQRAYADASAGINCTIEPELTPEKLVRWIRGEDNNAGLGEEDPAGPCLMDANGERASNCPITVRPSIHGDVLHSRPAVINYPTGSEGEEGNVVVFYGANDGVFRAVNGNQTRSINGVRPGGEMWGFIAPDFFGHFQRQYKNSPLISHPGSVDFIDPEPKPYFFDGSPTVLQDRRSVAHPDTKGKAFVYMSARRGGALLYALDVTDNMNPAFLWTVTGADIPQLGQTWSQPKLALLKGYATTVFDEDGNEVTVAKPVLVMGAGYDPEEDQDPGPGALDASYANSIGRGVIILDAVTGELVWAALPDCTGVVTVTGGGCVAEPALTRAIAADLTLMDSNHDGFIDRLYAADVGANLWRVDLLSETVSEWGIRKVASLGGTGNDARKFLFPPDVIPVRTASTNYDLLVAVSGDREHPLFSDEATTGLAYNVDNRFYLIKDVPGGAVIEEDELVDIDNAACVDSEGATVNCDAEGAIPVGFNISDNNFKGYFFTFRQGEKGVNAPLSVAGKVFFATNQPDDPNLSGASCTAGLGIARAYTVDFRAGTSTQQIFSGGGLPPSPIAGLVKIGDRTVPFIIGGTGPSPFDPGVPPIDLPTTRERLYQYFE